MQAGRLEVDDDLRVDDPPLHLSQQVGAAADGAGRGVAQQLQRVLQRGRALVPHASASITRAGVSGSAPARRPVACANAFAMAAAVGTIGGSPRPFAPTLEA